MDFFNTQFQKIRQQLMNTNMVTERGGTYRPRPMPNSIKISLGENYISSSSNHGGSTNKANLSRQSERISPQIESNLQGHFSQNIGVSFHSIASECTTKKGPKFSGQQNDLADLQKCNNIEAVYKLKNNSLLNYVSLKSRTYVSGQPIKSLLLPLIHEPSISNVPHRPYVSTGHVPFSIPEMIEESEKSTIEYTSSNGMNRHSYSTDISYQ